MLTDSDSKGDDPSNHSDPKEDVALWILMHSACDF